VKYRRYDAPKNVPGAVGLFATSAEYKSLSANKMGATTSVHNPPLGVGNWPAPKRRPAPLNGVSCRRVGAKGDVMSVTLEIVVALMYLIGYALFTLISFHFQEHPHCWVHFILLCGAVGHMLLGVLKVLGGDDSNLPKRPAT
jgi:hypothetical protein